MYGFAPYLVADARAEILNYVQTEINATFLTVWISRCFYRGTNPSVYCRAGDNLLSPHFASAKCWGITPAANVRLQESRTGYHRTTPHLVQVSLRRNLTKKPPIVGAPPPLWSSTPRGDKNLPWQSSTLPLR